MLYNLLLSLFALFYLPKLVFRGQKVKDRLKMDFSATGVIWIHAVSLGETKAVAPLAKRLKEKYPSAPFLVTSMTKTGHEEAKRSMPFADHFAYLPFDLSWIIRPVVRRLCPKLVIISETDLWLNFLNAAKEVGAKVVLVNGKLSERTFCRYQRFPSFSKKLLFPIDLFCVQSKEYADRFLSLGKRNVHVTGNTKFDFFPSSTPASKIKSPTLVLGSTHEGEEALFLDVVKRVWEKEPELKVLLVPRHPERFEAVATLLKEKEIPFTRFSEGGAVKKVMLVDEMGVLTGLYQLADVAVVGGSFVKGVGGHNILEPMFFSVPTLFGPFMESQLQLVQLTEEFGSGLQLPIEKLEENILRSLTDEAFRERMREGSKRLMQRQSEATEKTFSLIGEIP
jgi:3-deoxy-D-manno-octulosonic-acid transferase